MKLSRLLVLPLLLLFAGAAVAADHAVATLDEAAPADELSEPIRDALAETGLRVTRGAGTKVCDLWFCKEWQAKAGFTPSLSILYPFEVGELIGVVRYHRKGGDFRDQEIPSGLYTLRYAQQPVDGNHVGTSDTRDFLLLLPVAEDTEAGTMAEDAMWQTSAGAVGTNHPAMLSLVTAAKSDEELPAITHNEEFDRSSVRFAGQAKAGDKVEPLVVELIVVGHAAE